MDCFDTTQKTMTTLAVVGCSTNYANLLKWQYYLAV